MSLAERFSVFVDAGLLQRVPTRWQLLQGEIEMTPYVISTDATAEEGYRAHAFSHPLVRQLLIFNHVGAITCAPAARSARNSNRSARTSS